MCDHRQLTRFSEIKAGVHSLSFWQKGLLLNHVEIFKILTIYHINVLVNIKWIVFSLPKANNAHASLDEVQSDSTRPTFATKSIVADIIAVKMAHCEQYMQFASVKRSWLGVTLVCLAFFPALAAGAGGRCPAGYFCARGSSSPSPCPPGTFSNSSGNTAVSGCDACTPGFVCPNYATTVPSQLCAAGYVCRGGNAVESELCPVGSYCPAGSASPASCSAGTYQNVTGQSTCATCPASFYCGAGFIVPAVCPQGYFCPVGTRFASAFPCPAGTFSSATGLPAAAECAPCSSGSFCASTGLTAPTGLCSAGYVCTARATVASPTDNVTGYACPTGAYCTAGSSIETSCPPGTFNNATRGVSLAAACRPCTPGFTCPDAGTVSPFRLCDAGFVCRGGDAAAAELCALGSFCPAGSSAPTACAAGTYQNITGQSACATCPPSFFCGAGFVVPAACPPGYFCPSGTRFASQFPCPAGTFSAAFNLASAADCTPCSAGSYCASPGLTAPTGLCSSGVICTGGAMIAGPTDNVTGYRCPPGAYCTGGATAPTLCLPETFNTATGGSSVAACKPCTPGFTCPDAGTVSPYRACDAGFVCRGGDASATELCSLGSACPSGSSAPVACPAGTFANVTGLSACVTCPARSYCIAGAVQPVACPAGHFCPSGTGAARQFPCPVTTFAAQGGLADIGECSSCTPGSYCGSAGLTAPTGVCSAGYLCYGGAATPTPTDGVTGAIVAAGYYAVANSSAPTPCWPGTFNNGTGAGSSAACVPCLPGWKCPVSGLVAPPERCDAGFVCRGGDASATELCPLGHLCEVGSASPT